MTATAAVPDAPFIPTPPHIVEAMLDLAHVTSDDVLFDLGSGDGRIAIAAALRQGARAVGIELDSALVAQSTRAAHEHGVLELTSFRQENFFSIDLAPASVVTLYLLPSLNLRLLPKLLRELRAGARVVSHAFDMGEWSHAERIEVDGHRLFLWTRT
jgi:precorrin-6B methylase 2